ncbi:MAG: hypothetical protein DVB26_07030, partial [Verrucomicrobia bacterium]
AGAGAGAGAGAATGAAAGAGVGSGIGSGRSQSSRLLKVSSNGFAAVAASSGEVGTSTRGSWELREWCERPRRDTCTLWRL